MKGQVDCSGPMGTDVFEHIRRIGLAGETLAQLRADYERRPSPLVCEAIRRKIREISILGIALEEDANTVDLVVQPAG